jgi:hypothetical protein
MNGELSTEALRDVFYRTIKGVEQLKLDMNIYERLRENDVNKAFEWLLEMVQMEIRLKRQNRNMANREAHMGKSFGGSTRKGERSSTHRRQNPTGTAQSRCTISGTKRIR